ncbi:cytochrome P450 76T24-like isoform X2 [Salvia miltiorrhiza]|uniref:cytochrome P450 76T24-like isoform X2 n=1 Tax=Salvia miltiorrhiza TaxID=226208 RepID=UPI0025ABAB6F|nr:cytochrome P450 76T24-like isoform X2 [Salvia miltiorrhiza]
MMEFASFMLLLCIAFSCFHLLNLKLRQRRSLPGPYPFPIIGNIHQLGPKPHQSLTNLSKIYGPLMHLKLGSVPIIVVSSPEIARQILQRHDQAFPGRMTTAATKALRHHLFSVACLPAGSSQWRILRKLCREEMFSTPRLDAGRALRRRQLQKLLDYVDKCCVDRKAVDINEAAFVTSLNLISNTLFSMDFADYYGQGLSHEIVHGLMRAFGSFNVSDYFPMVGVFDPQRIKRDAGSYMGRLMVVFDGIIDRREESPEKKDDLLEALMARQNHSELSRDDIKHLLLDLFVAGTDTTSSTVEWAMTELMRNPHILSKAKTELQIILGQNKAVLQESDISKLPYLQALVKETFRYHPPGPFIARQKDGDDAEIGGHLVPGNAVVLINIWAIGRDSRIWGNPDAFQPERFLDGDIDVKGQDFELIPFGAGRRICPAHALAHRMLHLMLAAFIHNFDWRVENQVDVTEKFGLSLQKALPLKAMPIKL